MKKLSLFLFSVVAIHASAQTKWSLQDCVDYALKNNLQILQNQYSKDIQDLNLKGARKSYLPSVSANINNTMSFGQTAFGTSSIRNDRFSNNANIGADILVYNNGRLEKTVRKTEYDVEASIYDIETVKNDVSLQIAQQYLTVLLNKEIVKISESALDNAQKQRSRAKITTEVGTTAQSVLVEADAAVAREKQNLVTAKINVDRSLFALAQLLQLKTYQNFDIQDVVLPNELVAEMINVTDVIEVATANQPQVKAAASRVSAAKAQTEVTKTNFWPTVMASAGLGSFYNYLVSEEQTQGMTQSSFGKQYKDNFGQQVGVSVNIPIFNKGLTKLQVEQSKINEYIAENTLEQQKQVVLQNVQKAKFDADANHEIYLAALEAEKSSKIALEMAEKSYQAGRSTIYDLNVARNNYANAQGSTAQAKYNYLFSIKLLNFYVGQSITL